MILHQTCTKANIANGEPTYPFFRRFFARRWILSASACRLFPFFLYANVSVSALSMALVAVNRFMGIYRPRRMEDIYTPGKSVAMIVGVWAYSFGMMTLPLTEVSSRKLTLCQSLFFFVKGSSVFFSLSPFQIKSTDSFSAFSSSLITVASYSELLGEFFVYTGFNFVRVRCWLLIETVSTSLLDVWCFRAMMQCKLGDIGTRE